VIPIRGGKGGEGGEKKKGKRRGGGSRRFTVKSSAPMLPGRGERGKKKRKKKELRGVTRPIINAAGSGVFQWGEGKKKKKRRKRGGEVTQCELPCLLLQVGGGEKRGGKRGAGMKKDAYQNGPFTLSILISRNSFARLAEAGFPIEEKEKGKKEGGAMVGSLTSKSSA